MTVGVWFKTSSKTFNLLYIIKAHKSQYQNGIIKLSKNNM